MSGGWSGGSDAGASGAGLLQRASLLLRSFEVVEVVEIVVEVPRFFFIFPIKFDAVISICLMVRSSYFGLPKMLKISSNQSRARFYYISRLQSVGGSSISTC